MTEKPFIYRKCEDGFYDIINTRNCHAYPIGDMEILVIGIVELLNELFEENEQLKDENKELKEKIQLLQIELNADAKQYKIFIDIIDEADDLICSHLSKHYQRKWRNFCKNKEYDFE